MRVELISTCFIGFPDGDAHIMPVRSVVEVPEAQALHLIEIKMVKMVKSDTPLTAKPQALARTNMGLVSGEAVEAVAHAFMEAVTKSKKEKSEKNHA
jgi:hypothetical protein